MANRIELLLLLVDNEDGKPLREEVRVENCGNGQYRLLQSPGLVIGIAAGDVFTVQGDDTYKLVSRGGNVCIPIFSNGDLDILERAASAELAKLGGWLDGRSRTLLVYTVSVKAGFPEIQRVLEDIKRRFPEIEWYYGNVYDPVDGVTPLNWWLDA